MESQSSYKNAAFHDDQDDNKGGDDGVLGIRVMNFFGSWVNKQAAAYPLFLRGHPELFQGKVDIFLWGLISTSIAQALAAYRKRGGKYFMVTLVAIYFFMFIPFASSAMADFVYGTNLGLVLLLVGSFLVGFVMQALIVQQTVGEFHKDVAAIVSDALLQERFARAGYDIEYQVENKYNSMAILSYIRLIPTSRNRPVEHEQEAPEFFPSQSDLPIRLYTYRHQPWCGDNCCGDGYEGHRYRSANLMITGGALPEALVPWLDRSVFGALSETVQPALSKYREGGHSIFLQAFFIYYMMHHLGIPLLVKVGLTDEEDLYLCILLGVVGCFILMRRPFAVYKSRALHTACEEAVLKMTPELEARSDLTMKFVKHTDSYWWAESYIELVPKNLASVGQLNVSHVGGTGVSTVEHRPILANVV